VEETGAKSFVIVIAEPQRPRLPFTLPYPTPYIPYYRSSTHYYLLLLLYCCMYRTLYRILLLLLPVVLSLSLNL
jgi:hypothetical protein